MNSEHNTYLESIGTTRVARERIAALWGMVNRTVPGELQDIFVSETHGEDGVRSFMSVWFFTDHYISECKNFLEQTNFDFIKNSTWVFWLDITANNYEFNEIYSDNSTVKAVGRFGSGGGVSMTFSASRNNCPYLQKIIRQRLSPLTLENAIGRRIDAVGHPGLLS